MGCFNRGKLSIRVAFVALAGLPFLQGTLTGNDSQTISYWQSSDGLWSQPLGERDIVTLGELRNLVPEARYWGHVGESERQGDSGFQTRIELGLGDARRTSANFAPRLVPFGGPLSYARGRDFSFTLDEPGDSKDSPDLLSYYRIELPFERDSMSMELSVGQFGSYRGSFLGRMGSEQSDTEFTASYREFGDYVDGSGVPLTESLDLSNPKHSFIPEAGGMRSYQIYEYGLSGRVIFTPNQWVDYAIRHSESQDVLFPELRMDAEYDRGTVFSATYRMLKPSATLQDLTVRLFGSLADQELNDRLRVSKYRVEPDAGVEGVSSRAISKSESRGLDFRAVKELPDSSIGFGVRWNWQYWDMFSKTLGESRAIMPLISQINLSTYIEGDKLLGNFLVSGALRIDQFETEPRTSLAQIRVYRPSVQELIRENALSSRLRLEYGITESSLAYVELGHAVRLPDPHEMYLQYEQQQAPGNVWSWIGNPDLRSVKNSSLDLGMDSRFSRIRISLKAFYSIINDLIYIEPMDPDLIVGSLIGSVWSYVNIDARLYGGDIVFEWDLADAFRLEGGVEFLHGSKKSLDGYSGDPDLAEMPPVRGRLAVSVHGNRWRGKAEMKVADSMLKIDQSLQELPLEGYTVYNLVAAYQFTENLQWSLGVDNVGNRLYASRNVNTRNPFSHFGLTYDPGRFVYTSVRLKF